MKKMIIYMPKLSVGGMEKALLNLLNFSDLTKIYEIELFLGYVLEKEYLKLIPKNVKIVICCKKKWNILGKIKAYFKMNLKRIKILLKVDKYDVAISYAYQHAILASLARMSSKNNIIFVHNNLLLARSKKQIDCIKFDKFSKVICVSNDAKKAFYHCFPKYDGKVEVINNYIDGDHIIESAKEEINFEYEKPVFINIARHEEKSKKISRIIESAKLLKEKKYIFSILLIGDGKDHQMYKKMIEENGLTDVIKLLGKQVNPYKYLIKSNAFILSSAYEGYGIVIDEARILNVPVISTDVADAKKILKTGFGILCDNSSEGIYQGIKKYLDEGYIIKKTFDYKAFNRKITSQLNRFIEE